MGRIPHWLPPVRPNVRTTFATAGLSIAVSQTFKHFEAFTLDLMPLGRRARVGLFIVRRAIEVLGHGIDVSSVALPRNHASSKYSQHNGLDERHHRVRAKARSTEMTIWKHNAIGRLWMGE